MMTSATSTSTQGLIRRRVCRPPSGESSLSTYAILLVTLALVGLCLWQHKSQPHHELTTQPIEQIRLGDNVPGVNPEGEEDFTFGDHVDPETWQALFLTGILEDGSTLEIELLRPASWLAEHRVPDGDHVIVRFDEIGFRGEAKVESVEPCPPVRAGPGQTVTGIFRHHAGEILDLTTSNGERIGVTPNHPFWSEDQQDFVPAGELSTGETLRLLNGKTRVTALTPRQSTEPVYNLEVQVSHVFHVAESGVLVHNNGGGPACGIGVDRVGKRVREDVVEVDLNKLEPVHNIHKTPDEMRDLANSIQTKGFDVEEAVPVVQMPDGRIFNRNGHHRSEAMRILKEKTVPATIEKWEDMTEFAKREYWIKWDKIQDLYPDLAPSAL